MYSTSRLIPTVRFQPAKLKLAHSERILKLVPLDLTAPYLVLTFG
jgi:hypothetical protein